MVSINRNRPKQGDGYVERKEGHECNSHEVGNRCHNRNQDGIAEVESANCIVLARYGYRKRYREWSSIHINEVMSKLAGSKPETDRAQ